MKPKIEAAAGVGERIITDLASRKAGTRRSLERTSPERRYEGTTPLNRAVHAADAAELLALH
jgi:hypothetical protein